MARTAASRIAAHFRFALLVSLLVGSAKLQAQPAPLPDDAATPRATPAYALSAPFETLWRADSGATWTGEHRFQDVFCLRFPDAAESTVLAETMFNDNTLYFSRVEYPGRRLNLYVVTSQLPVSLSPEAEHAAQAALAQRYVEQIPTHARAGESQTALGPSVSLRLRNVLQGDGSAPFPFERRFFGEIDAPLHTLSTHRLFTNNGSRIELAALQAFVPPAEEEAERAAIEALEAFVDRAVDSLTECTVTLQEREG